jgi:Amt family ammonium transporter
MIDFAGSGVVHMVGGVAGLVGAIAVGPRIGRFDADGKPVTLPGHSATLVVLGTFILWFGWYGFNPGSTLAVADASSLTVTAHTAVTTTLGAASGGVTSLFLVYFLTGVWDLLAVCNGLLAGLVSITAGCSVVQAWAAVLIGFIGAFVFYYSCKLLEKLKIDDPLLAAPMHGFCGMWGVIAVGLLAEESKLRLAYPTNYAVENVAAVPRTSKGAFYKGDGRLLGCQVCGIVCITAWVTGMMSLLFFPLKFLGLLRVPQDFEMAGLDASKHGGSAYNMDNDQMKKSPAGF